MEILKKKIRFRIIFMIDVLILLFIQVLQGASLNYYFIRQYEEYFTTYFLFILDFFCLCVFCLTFYISYNYFIRSHDESQTRLRKITNMEKRFPKSIYGVLPLSYVSWLIYVAILITKLSIIFGTDIARNLNNDKHLFSAQILQVKFVINFALHERIFPCIKFELILGVCWYVKYRIHVTRGRTQLASEVV